MLIKHIAPGIATFHQKRLDNLQNLKLEKIIKRKNPYLFRAKNLITAHDLVKSLLDAHLSSQEEGIFGELLESLAIFICYQSFGGRKSGIEGIDLELFKDGVHYLVSIKSGPNWGNSQQIKRMRDNFKSALKTMRTNAPKQNIICINGCCYGIDDNPEKGDYIKLCGQRFWSFLSGDDFLYCDIIDPLGHQAKEKNEIFQKEYNKVINKFSLEFIQSFCDPDGSILWERLVQKNSKAFKNIDVTY